FRLPVRGPEDPPRLTRGFPRSPRRVSRGVRRRRAVGPRRHGRAGVPRSFTWRLPHPVRRHRLRRQADRRVGPETLRARAFRPKAEKLMNLDLSEEHELIRRTVREFALERIAPVAEE